MWVAVQYCLKYSVRRISIINIKVHANKYTGYNPQKDDIHKVLCEYVDSGEGFGPHASKQTR